LFHLTNLEAPVRSTTGQGFVLVPGGLPGDIASTLTGLSLVDQLMSQCGQQRLEDAELRMLLSGRNAFQHRLLSLPAWNELNQAERGNSYLATYECCRLASILYSNAVLLGLPPHTGWHMRLVSKLKTLLEISNLQGWAEDTAPLLIWTLTIVGIASHWTGDQKFFEDLLRDTLAKNNVSTKSGVRAILGDFLWTENACGQGAMVLWDAIDFDKTSK
jgi:hypothetical protein